LHLIKDLKWRINLFDDAEATEYLCKNSIELEADVDGEEAEELSNALKALIRIRQLRRNELERLKALPLKEACKELVARMVLEG